MTHKKKDEKIYKIPFFYVIPVVQRMLLHKEIQRLKQHLLTLGTIVEDRVTSAVKAVDKRDLELAARVIDGDEEIDAMEVDLEEECLKVLALHQPVAIDLRVIIAVLKINSDLERIGDLAVDIAERGKYFATHREIEFPFDFPAMSGKVHKMLQNSLDALVNLDVELAKTVCAADDVVDDLHRNMYQQIEDAIKIQPHYTEQLLNYMSVSRYLERIADHATNIAEDVMYLASGDIVRHKQGFF